MIATFVSKSSEMVVFRLEEIITLIDKNLYEIKIKFLSIFRNFAKGGGTSLHISTYYRIASQQVK